MKALTIPTALLALVLALSLWVGTYAQAQEDRWTAMVALADEAAAREDWPQAAEKLQAAYRDWADSQQLLYTIMDHDQLDAAEIYFIGAMAVCRERDGADFHLLLAQLTTQLQLLAETQCISIKNIL